MIKKRGTTVIVRNHENINQALKRFKKKVADSNKLEDLKKKEYYEKPTVKRRRARSLARARWLKKLEKESQLTKDSYQSIVPTKLVKREPKL